MDGHGTVISGSDGQDDTAICIDNNGGSNNYATGSQQAVNQTGGSVQAGQVVSVSWSDNKNELQIVSVGTQATGQVSSSGTSITISSSGDTALTGTVAISSSHGQNEGYAGASVSFGNIDGEASYLS